MGEIMALTYCPCCGNKVSDSANRCPKCGYDFTANKEITNRQTNFFKLPENEQQTLRKEFYSAFPAEKKHMDKVKRHNILYYAVTVFICILTVLFIILYFTKAFNILSLIVFAVFLLISLILVIVVKIRTPILNKRTLLHDIRLANWLNESKQLQFPIELTIKQQIIYNRLIAEENSRKEKGK